MSDIPIGSERLLHYPELKLIGISYSKMHLSRLEKVGKFPRRIFLSKNRIVWRSSEITSWMEEQFKRRDATPMRGGQ